MKFFVFLIDVFRQTLRYLYTRLSEFVYRFFAEVPIIDSFAPPSSQYINGMITISGTMLPTGPVEVIYAGLAGPAIDNRATGTGGTTVQSRVPDDAVPGVFRIRKGTVESLLSRSRLGINNPVIDSSDPPLIIDTVTLIGNGFSNEHPHTVSFNGTRVLPHVSRSVPDVRTDDENGQRLSLTMPPDAPYGDEGSIVIVVVRPGGALTSSPFRYRRGRRLNGFTRVEFANLPRDYHCGDATFTIESPPPPDPVTGRQEIPFRFSRGRRGPFTGDPFQVAGGIGGVAFSPCCDQVASLSYLDGALDPSSSGARFNLIILDTNTGTPLLTEVVHSTSTGAPLSQLPELYFSPDCTIIAVTATRFGGGGNLWFFDFLNRARGPWGGGDFPSGIVGFTARVTDEVTSRGEQIIVYTTKGREPVPEPIPIA